jgi:hypothetical protein
VLDDVPCVAPPQGHRLRCDSVLAGTNITERIVSALVIDFDNDGADDLLLGGFNGGLYYLLVSNFLSFAFFSLFFLFSLLLSPFYFLLFRLSLPSGT